jgi:(p)ppGpp synthase/HD superfamily hydrolase
LGEKIESKNLSIEQINDLLGVRIYLKNPAQCFEVMKVIIKEYKVLKDRLKDYISYPKENGYQSLHLTIDYNAIPIEIQIRTHEMHKNCQTGSASHVNYKKNRAS